MNEPAEELNESHIETKLTTDSYPSIPQEEIDKIISLKNVNSISLEDTYGILRTVNYCFGSRIKEDYEQWYESLCRITENTGLTTEKSNQFKSVMTTLSSIALIAEGEKERSYDISFALDKARLFWFDCLREIIELNEDGHTAVILKYIDYRLWSVYVVDLILCLERLDRLDQLIEEYPDLAIAKQRCLEEARATFGKPNLSKWSEVKSLLGKHLMDDLSQYNSKDDRVWLLGLILIEKIIEYYRQSLVSKYSINLEKTDRRNELLLEECLGKIYCLGERLSQNQLNAILQTIDRIASEEGIALTLLIESDRKILDVDYRTSPDSARHFTLCFF